VPNDVKIDRGNALALYQQIVEQIKDQICDGRLPAGARLPTVRQMAADLGVTRLTVQNAYAELQNSGWLEATVGRGTFVSHNVHPASFGRAMAHNLTPDAAISDILQVNQVVGLRSLASASPDPQLFPAEEFWHSLAGLQHELPVLTTYSSTQGDPSLRVEISQDLHERGIDAGPHELIITAGVTQALALVAQVLAQPGDRVLVEQPTYLGLLHTLKVHGLEPAPVAGDEHGILIEELERAIVQHRPRFLYIVPTFQNPTGRCLAGERRQALVELAAAHNVLVIEDDIYARLAYDGPPPLPLKTLDRAANVLYASSYSKVLMPGLRLGYLLAPAHLTERLLSLRRATDLCSPPLLQRTLAAFLHSGGLKRHLKRVVPQYRERRNVLVAALQRYMPASVQWTIPQGGFCAWLTLPNYHDFADLEQAALRLGWAFTPGEVFLAAPEARKSLRLCFGSQPPETLRAGVELLGRLIESRILTARSSAPVTADWAPLV
jgi:DNA-binding transcriptional MocR family regulator